MSFFKIITSVMAISLLSSVAFAQSTAPAKMSAEQYNATAAELDSYKTDMQRLVAEEHALYPETQKAHEAGDTKKLCTLAKSTISILNQEIARIDLAKSRLVPVGVDVSSMAPLRDLAEQNLGVIKPFVEANCRA